MGRRQQRVSCAAAGAKRGRPKGSLKQGGAKPEKHNKVNDVSEKDAMEQGMNELPRVSGQRVAGIAAAAARPMHALRRLACMPRPYGPPGSACNVCAHDA